MNFFRKFHHGEEKDPSPANFGLGKRSRLSRYGLEHTDGVMEQFHRFVSNCIVEARQREDVFISAG